MRKGRSDRQIARCSDCDRQKNRGLGVSSRTGNVCVVLFLGFASVILTELFTTGSTPPAPRSAESRCHYVGLFTSRLSINGPPGAVYIIRIVNIAFIKTD